MALALIALIVFLVGPFVVGSALAWLRIREEHAAAGLPSAPSAPSASPGSPRGRESALPPAA